MSFCTDIIKLVNVMKLKEEYVTQNLTRQVKKTKWDESYSGEDGMGYIELLDIFGFESFETNQFEKICINYANERHTLFKYEHNMRHGLLSRVCAH